MRVKICCISTIEEARMAIGHGAAALGLVSKMPSGPGVIPESRIAEIADTVPPSVASFLLTSEVRAETIIEQQRRCRANTLQLVDRVDRGVYCDLRRALPGISIVQVIHVTGEESVEEAVRISGQGVHGLLLDSGNQQLAIKELGGTGRTHDWTLSRRICQRASVPVFLAGGLNPSNVAEAVRAVDPFGVDVCSGVRTDGKLDEKKLSDFLAAVFQE